MNNLIFNAFSFNINNSTNLSENSRYQMYLKNIFVSLKTAKTYNPNDEVALVVDHILPNKYIQIFQKSNIKIFIIPFDYFVFPNEFKWKSAFFKLESLRYLCMNTHYKNYLLLDTDTVTVSDYQEMWNELDSSILLYNTNHSYNHKVRRQMRFDYEKLFGQSNNIVQYGGEYIASNSENLVIFIKKLENIFKKIENSNFKIDLETGDEFLVSIAASQLDIIVDSNAYIERFWTGKFYLVSTKYYYDKVCILHVPAEKEYGMISIYKRLWKHKNLSPQKIYKILGLPKKYRVLNYYTVKRIISKLIKSRRRK